MGQVEHGRSAARAVFFWPSLGEKKPGQSKPRSCGGQRREGIPQDKRRGGDGDDRNDVNIDTGLHGA